MDKNASGIYKIINIVTKKVSQKELAEWYNISQSQISAIISYKCWKV